MWQRKGIEKMSASVESTQKITARLAAIFIASEIKWCEEERLWFAFSK